MCVCVCVCSWARTCLHTRCICMCVHVCVWAHCTGVSTHVCPKLAWHVETAGPQPRAARWGARTQDGDLAEKLLVHPALPQRAALWEGETQRSRCSEGLRAPTPSTFPNSPSDSELLKGDPGSPSNKQGPEQRPPFTAQNSPHLPLWGLRPNRTREVGPHPDPRDGGSQEA